MTPNWSPATSASPTASVSCRAPSSATSCCAPALNPPPGTVTRQRARPGRALVDLGVVRTVLVTIAASLLAGLVAYVVDRLLGLQR